MKLFYKSKTFWLGVLTILVSLQNLISEFSFSNMQAKDWALFVIGILIIILRYFTYERITFKRKNV